MNLFLKIKEDVNKLIAIDKKAAVNNKHDTKNDCLFWAFLTDTQEDRKEKMCSLAVIYMGTFAQKCKTNFAVFPDRIWSGGAFNNIFVSHYR